jgi:hypothetical protein
MQTIETHFNTLPQSQNRSDRIRNPSETKAKLMINQDREKDSPE